MAHGGKRVVPILVNALEAESVDGSERVVQLYACEHLTVFMVERRVHASEHRLVHLENLVAVVTEIDVHIHRKLTGLYQLVGIDMEFPSYVTHLTRVAVRQGVVTGIGRNPVISHKHVFGSGAITLKRNVDFIIKETDIHT